MSKFNFFLALSLVCLVGAVVYADQACLDQCDADALVRATACADTEAEDKADNARIAEEAVEAAEDRLSAEIDSCDDRFPDNGDFLACVEDAIDQYDVDVGNAEANQALNDLLAEQAREACDESNSEQHQECIDDCCPPPV